MLRRKRRRRRLGRRPNSRSIEGRLWGGAAKVRLDDRIIVGAVRRGSYDEIPLERGRVVNGDDPAELGEKGSNEEATSGEEA